MQGDIVFGVLGAGQVSVVASRANPTMGASEAAAAPVLPFLRRRRPGRPSSSWNSLFGVLCVRGRGAAGHLYVVYNISGGFNSRQKKRVIKALCLCL